MYSFFLKVWRMTNWLTGYLLNVNPRNVDFSFSSPFWRMILMILSLFSRCLDRRTYLCMQALDSDKKQTILMMYEVCEEYDEEPSVIDPYQGLLFEDFLDILESDGSFEFDWAIGLLYKGVGIGFEGSSHKRQLDKVWISNNRRQIINSAIVWFIQRSKIYQCLKDADVFCSFALFFSFGSISNIKVS